MHLSLILGIPSVPGHPLIIRRKCLSTQYKVAESSISLVCILRSSRFPLAPYTHRSSATMVFACPRKATDTTRLLEIVSQGVPRKLFI
jgi:hypothetical protein